MDQNSTTKKTPKKQERMSYISCSNAYKYGCLDMKNVTVPFSVPHTSLHKKRKKEATAWGVLNEASARQWIRHNTHLRVETVGKLFKKDQIVCRPDGLVYDDTLPAVGVEGEKKKKKPYLLEIKCPANLKNVKSVAHNVYKTKWLQPHNPCQQTVDGTGPPPYLSACGRWKLNHQSIQGIKYWYQLRGGDVCLRTGHLYPVCVV